MVSLDALFRPSSIALVDLTNETESLGFSLLHNLLHGNFSGPILPVSSSERSVCGVLAFDSVEALPLVPDLAVICADKSQVLVSLQALADKGVKHIIIATPALKSEVSASGEHLVTAILDIVKAYSIRLLGPHALGLIVPSLGLNASCAHSPVSLGNIALVTQSSAVGEAILEWASDRKLGFSYVIGLGETSDIDIAEVLDFLGRDPSTQSILLYIDHIKSGRTFISAARAASSIKPLVVIKSGRYAQPGSTHELTGSGTAELTASAATADVIYDAAFKRAGMLRVVELQELFAAAETLAHGQALRGERLMIISNGRGSASMAVDALISRGGRLQIFTEAKKDTGEMPANLSISNPMLLNGNAAPADYIQAMESLNSYSDIDNILVLHTPTRFATAREYASSFADYFKTTRPNKKNVFVSWLGDESFRSTRELFSEAKIASYRTPESAVRAFMYMLEYRRNQKLLHELPEVLLAGQRYDTEKARSLIEHYKTANKKTLNNQKTDELLGCYGIAFAETRYAISASMAGEVADEIGFPVVVKLNCPTLEHVYKYGGVSLNLESKAAVESASQDMQQRMHSEYPEVLIEGFVVQKMLSHLDAHEIRIVVASDAAFGPVIYLGQGSTQFNLQRDTVVGFPPLNSTLARYLIIQALAEDKIRDRHLSQPLDREALAVLLSQVSQLLVDNPEISNLDINPVLAQGDKLTVLDAQIKFTEGFTKNKLAVRPYPKELERIVTIKNGEKIFVRPIRAEDWSRHLEFDQSLSVEDRYKRYFGTVPALAKEQLAQLTQIDYDREMVLIAKHHKGRRQEETLAVVNVVFSPVNDDAEFAITVRTDMQGLGIGKVLMQIMMDYCRQQKVKVLKGETLLTNRAMAKMARNLGFTTKQDLDDRVTHMRIDFMETES